MNQVEQLCKLYIFWLMLQSLVLCGKPYKIFKHDDSIDGRVCPSPQRSFTKMTDGILVCSYHCMLNASCKSFFYGQTAGTCYGCSNIYTTFSTLDAESETVYYKDQELAEVGSTAGASTASIGTITTSGPSIVVIETTTDGRPSTTSTGTPITVLPSTTSTEPTSTAGPSTTSTEPTSTAEPSTTSTEPTTTVKPSTTSTEPTTTAEPSTTSTEPTTTAEPSTTSTEPTTTAEPSTTSTGTTTTDAPSTDSPDSTTTAASSTVSTDTTTTSNRGRDGGRKTATSADITTTFAASTASPDTTTTVGSSSDSPNITLGARLSNDGEFFDRGRVEVLGVDSATWGTVCDDGWLDRLAGHKWNNIKVLCGMFGYSNGTVLERATYPLEDDTGVPIWFTYVACDGHETSIFINGTVLERATYPLEDDTGVPIWFTYVACEGDEASIYDCNELESGRKECLHTEDLMIHCHN